MASDRPFQRYRDIRMLGEGAMGLVWLMEDTATGERVALKVLARRRAATPEARLQLAQEFRLMTQLRHPHCCEVREYGLAPDGAPFFTMEVVPGQGLDELLPLDPARFRALFPQLLEALAYLHRRGFVHNDLKPANVRVTPDGQVKLMDFGLMEHAGRSGGAIKGTVHYLAPEVIQRGRVDARADLYAAGALAYELLAGRPPFQAETIAAVLQAHLQERPLPPSAYRNGIPGDLDAFVLRLLAKVPLERFQSAGEALAALGHDAPPGLGGALLASPLVGRDDELARVAAALTRMTSDPALPGDTLALCGPAGRGKSRLVEAIRHRVQLAGLPCGVGQAAAQVPVPYGAFVGALRRLRPELEARAPQLLAELRPVLVKLLPELGGAAAPDLDPPAREQARLHAAVEQTLTALAGSSGLALVLEDWQRADPASRALLAHLLRTAAGLPLLLVVTSREAPAAMPAGLDALALPPLAPAATAHMVASMLGRDDVDPAFLAAVERRTGGHPQAIESLIEHLARAGRLRHGAGAGADLEGLELPADPAGWLALADLPADAQELARTAAVLGAGLTLPVLGQAAGLAEDALLDALDALLGRQVLVRDEHGTYGFAWAEAQEALYAGMTADERTERHGRAAAALAASWSGYGLAELPLDALAALAEHGLRGDRRAGLAAIALEAGRRHAALFDNAAAERYLAAALAVMGPDDAAERLEALRRLGDVRRVAGRQEPAALDAYREALALAQAAGNRALEGELLTSMAKVHQVLDALEEALACGEAALAACEAAGDLAGAARALTCTGRIRFFRGDPAGAAAENERALQLAREAGDAGKAAAALGFLGYVQATAQPGREAEGVRHLREAVELLGSLDDRVGLASACQMLGDALLSRGELGAAREAFARSRALCLGLGNRNELAFALLNLANAALEQGAFADALATAEEAHAVALETHNRYAAGMALTLTAAAEGPLGRYEAARAHLAEAGAIARDLDHAYMATYVHAHALELALLLGQLDQAEAASAALAAAAAQTGNAAAEGRRLTVEAVRLARAGDLAGGRAAALDALGRALAAGQKPLEARARRSLAWLAALAEDWPEARAQAEEAWSLAEAIGARLTAAEALALLAEVELALGLGDPQARFAKARGLAEAMGTPLLRAIAAFGVASAGAAGPAARDEAAEARAALTALARRLPEDEREGFLAARERARVIAGSPLAGRTVSPLAAPDTLPPTPLGLHTGTWDMG